MQPVHTGAEETKAQRLARGALALGLVVLGIYTLQNFLPALVWAAIFAVAIWPLYRRIRTGPAGQRHTTLIPLAFTLAVALVFIIPVVLVGVQLAKEAHSTLDWLQQIQDNGIPVPDIIHRLPYGDQAISGWWAGQFSAAGGCQSAVRAHDAGPWGD